MRHHEYLILGAGPAGLQAAHHLKHAGRDYCVLERGERAGNFFGTYPRHRTLISVNKVYTGYDDPETNLRWDWNSILSVEQGPTFSEFSEEYFPPAQSMLEYLDAYRRRHELDVRFGMHIRSVRRSADGFELTDQAGDTWTCKRLIVATGVSLEYVPDIPGIEYCETYGQVSLERSEFRNARVLILGKGNSAFETADHLVGVAASIHVASPSPLKFAWRTHYVGHLRAVNNNLLDTYHLKLQNAVLDCTVLGIQRKGRGYDVTVAYTHANGEVETLYYDRVISCTGFRFDDSIFEPESRPALTACRRFPAQTPSWESVNVPGLFFAGTLMQGCAPKKFTSGFVHGFRYNVRALARVLDERFHARPWPVRTVEDSAEAIAACVLARINRSSALWQQPGLVCDALAVRARGDVAFYEELTMPLARERLDPTGIQYFTVTLEFGPNQDDPFSGERVHRQNHRAAELSKFLHPIVRHYARGQLQGEHHVLEDLAGEWQEPEHSEPLIEFLRGALKGHTREREAPMMHHVPAASAMTAAGP